MQDQLQEQKRAGRIFRFMHEAPIAFAPTYKFDKGDPNRLAYDSSEKQRVPAWTDRILFRGSELARGAESHAEVRPASEAPANCLVTAASIWADEGGWVRVCSVPLRCASCLLPARSAIHPGMRGCRQGRQLREAIVG